MKGQQKSQFIFYDGEIMKCFNCCNVNYSQEPRTMNCITPFMDNPIHISFGGSYSFEVDLGKEIIELDPTTMKRIAKYNAEKEVDILIRKKQVLEDEIKQLEENKQSQIKKLDSLKQFCKEFIISDEDDIDEYIDANYSSDYDEYE